jgi:L-fucose isomerase-like protein
MRNKRRFETDKTDVMNVQFSNHAAKRVSQRGIEPAVIAEIIKYGTRIHKQGKVFHYICKADIQLYYHKDDRKRFESVIVLTGQDGRVVTTYRNPDAVSEIKRKPKRLSQKPKHFLHNIQVAQQLRTNRNAA